MATSCTGCADRRLSGARCALPALCTRLCYQAPDQLGLCGLPVHTPGGACVVKGNCRIGVATSCTGCADRRLSGARCALPDLCTRLCYQAPDQLGLCGLPVHTPGGACVVNGNCRIGVATSCTGCADRRLSGARCALPDLCTWLCYQAPDQLGLCGLPVHTPGGACVVKGNCRIGVATSCTGCADRRLSGARCALPDLCTWLCYQAPDQLG